MSQEIPTQSITIKIQITAWEVYSLWALYGVKKHMMTASALLESVHSACLQIAPGGGAVLAIRDRSALGFAEQPKCLCSFQCGDSLVPHLHINRAHPHSRLFAPLLAIQLEAVSYLDMTHFGVVLNNLRFDCAHERGCNTDWSSSTARCSGDALRALQQISLICVSNVLSPSAMPALCLFPFAWHFCPYSRADATEGLAQCKAWLISPMKLSVI